MRKTTLGLHRGTRVKVRGAGKYARGAVCVEPVDGATHVSYRCDYNLGERLARIDDVRLERRANRRARA